MEFVKSQSGLLLPKKQKGFLHPGLLVPKSDAEAVLPAVVGHKLPSSTGSEDITGSFSWTPVACIAICCASESKGITDVDGCLSVGFCDGTRSRYTTDWVVQGYTNTYAGQYSGTRLFGAVDETHEVRGDFTTFIPGGVRINVSTGGTLFSPYIVFIFFPPSWSAYVGDATVNTSQNGKTDVTAPGFQPDLIMSTMPTQDTSGYDNSGNEQHCAPCYGISDGAAEWGLMTWVTDNAGTTECAQLLSLGLVAQDSNGVNFANDAAFRLTDFDSSGFSIQTVYYGTTALELGYIALKNDLAIDDAELFVSANSTGDEDHTNTTFTPGFALKMMSCLESYDATAFDATAECQVFGVFTENEIFSIGYTVDDGASTGNTSGIYYDDQLWAGNHAESEEMDATFVEFISTGYTLNYTTAPGTAFRGWDMAIGIV